MRQPIVRRFAIASTLAITFFLAQPGAAQARDLRTGGAWGWLQQLWTQGMARLWVGAAVPPPAGASRKDGKGIGWLQTPPVSSGSLDATSTDEGHGLDPNG
jgi:hypothetical protein